MSRNAEFPPILYSVDHFRENLDGDGDGELCIIYLCVHRICAKTDIRNWTLTPEVRESEVWGGKSSCLEGTVLTVLLYNNLFILLYHVFLIFVFNWCSITVVLSFPPLLSPVLSPPIPTVNRPLCLSVPMRPLCMFLGSSPSSPTLLSAPQKYKSTIDIKNAIKYSCESPNISNSYIEIYEVKIKPFTKS